jgi:hypothetical protein
MNRLPLNALAFIPLAMMGGLFAPAAMAQQEKVNQVIVYGNDQCKPSSDDEIVVCNRLPEGDRYRVPQIFRGGDPLDPRNEAWMNRVVAVERIGRFGTDSCSPVGLGGFTGCTQALVAGARAEEAASSKTDWLQMIREEREKRVAGFDQAAQEVENAVLAEERAMDDRRRAAAELEAQGNGVRLPAPSSDSGPDAPLPTVPPRQK